MAILQDTTIRDCLITGEVEFYDCDIKLNADEEEYIVLKIVNRELRIKDETKETLADLHAKNIEADGFFVGDGSHLTNVVADRPPIFVPAATNMDAKIPVKLIEFNGAPAAAPIEVTFDDELFEKTDDVSLGQNVIKPLSRLLTRDLGVVAFIDSGNNNRVKAFAVNVHSDNPISVGPISDTTIVSNQANPFSVARVSDTKFVMTINQNNDIRILQGKVTNNGVSFGASQSIGGREASRVFNVEGENRVVVVYSEGNRARARVVTYNETTLAIDTIHPNIQISNNGIRNISGCNFSNVKFITAYSDNGNNNFGTVQVIDRSGTSLTAGTKTVFEASNLNLRDIQFDIIATDSDEAIVAYEKDTGTNRIGNLRKVIVSGNVISLESEILFDDPTSPETLRRVRLLDVSNPQQNDTRFVIAYTVVNTNTSEASSFIRVGRSDDIATSISQSLKQPVTAGSSEIIHLSLSSVNSIRSLATLRRAGQEAIGFSARFQIDDGRPRYVAYTNEAGIQGEMVEIIPIARVLDDIQANGGLPLEIGQNYYLNDLLELTRENTGFPAGIAIDFDRLFLMKNVK